MAPFWNLRRVRDFIAMQRRFDRYDLADELAGATGDPDRPIDQTYVSVSVLGFRAEAEGKTGFAALNAMRREHPVVVHLLYAYTALLMVLAVTFVVRLAWW